MENSQLLDSTINQDQTVRERHLVSGWIRFANYIIDVIIFYIIMFVFGIILGITGNADFAAEGGPAISLIGILFFMAYYILFESMFGKTVGKMITKTRVVLSDFSKPGFGTILLRTICRLIPFEPLSCIGVASKGWHDRFAKTWVVSDNSIGSN
jgi:uncharacterized RDD family membrane protein YckC